MEEVWGKFTSGGGVRVTPQKGRLTDVRWAPDLTEDRCWIGDFGDQNWIIWSAHLEVRNLKCGNTFGNFLSFISLMSNECEGAVRVVLFTVTICFLNSAFYFIFFSYKKIWLEQDYVGGKY